MSKLSFRLRSSVGDWIRAGDRSRDRKLWLEAASYYERVLEAKPSLTAIWVQLGHVRKEGGNLAAAEEAYLSALKLQPDGSDTALHMGHLSKVSGNIETAEIWYGRALQMDRDNVHARRELAMIRGSGALASVVDIEEIAFRSSPIKTFFWDCTAHRNWHNGKNSISPEARWFAKVGKALSRTTHIVPIAFDEDNACFVGYSFDLNQSEFQPERRIEASTDEHCALVVDCYADVQTPSLIRLLSSARNTLNLTVIGVLRSPLTGGGTDVNYRSGIDHQFENLMVVARNAATLVTRQGQAREWAEDVAMRAGRPSASVITVESPDLSGPRSVRTIGDTQRSRIVVLAPSAASEWDALRGQLALLCDSSIDISLVGAGSVTECANAPLPGSDCRSIEICESEVAWSEIEANRVRAILISASRFDGSIWAAHAKRHGTEIFCHASNLDVVDELGGYANFFADGRPVDLSGISWSATTSDKIDEHDDRLYQPWRVAFNSIERNVIDDAVPPRPANVLDYGIFYGLEATSGQRRLYSESDGLPMLKGRGWGRTTQSFTHMGEQVVSLEFVSPVHTDAEINCRILVYVLSNDEGEKINDFFWHQAEATLCVRAGANSRQSICSVTINAALFGREYGEHKYAIGGFVAYPSDQDHCWHEFLDRTSRTIYSFRNVLTRGTFVELSQPA